MKKKAKNGSALVFVLMTLSILSILGIAMISLSTMSFKMRKFTSNVTSNQYASESGLDEAYTIIKKYSEGAIEKSNSVVEQYIKDVNLKIATERQVIDEFNYGKDNSKLVIENLGSEIKYYEQIGDLKVIRYKLDNDENLVYYNESSEEVKIEYLDLVGNLNEDKKQEIEQEKRKKFKTAFKDYFDKNKDNNITKLVSDLESESNYLVLKDDEIFNEEDEENKNIKVIKFDNNFYSNSDKLEITLSSRFKVESIEKAVQATFEIGVPEYYDITKLQDKYYSIYRNPIWEKAMCIDGNLEIKSGDLAFNNGDVYIKGSQATKYRGVIISGNGKGSVFKNSNLVTANDIIFNSNVVGSRILAANNIYSRNIIMEKDSKGGSLYTGEACKEFLSGPYIGDVYLLDDMELNARGSIISIGGSLYGLSDGSSSFESDHSSSIIINTDDIGRGVEADTSSSLYVKDKVYLLGTSYINGLKYYGNDYKYQTGESISIKGKYKAYTQSISSFLDVNFEYFQPLSLASENYASINMNEIEILPTVKYYSYFDSGDDTYKIKSYITVNITQNGLENYINAAKYSINYKGSLYNINRFGEPTVIERQVDENDKIHIKIYTEDGIEIKEFKEQSIKDIQLSIEQLSKYFTDYYDVNTDNDEDYIRAGITIGDLTESYHVGAIYDWTKGSLINQSNISIDKEEEILNKTLELKDELFYLGNGHDKGFDYNSVALINSPQYFVDTEINFDDNAFNTTLNIDSNRTKFYNSSDLVLGGTINCGNYNTIILNNDSDNTILLGEGNAESGKIRINTNNFNGIIITSGNIEIDNNVVYKGIIIAKGDVTNNFGNSSFIYDKDFVENTVTANYKIFDGVFKQFRKDDKIEVEEYGNGDSNITKNEIILVKDWFIKK